MAGRAIPGRILLKNETSRSAVIPAKSVEDLVAQHTMMVFRICWSILRNHHDAEDATQECFLRVLKREARIHEVRDPKAWLARIAWTTALDRRCRRPLLGGAARDLKICDEDALSQLADSAPSLEQQLANMELQEILEQLIAALPEELRQPLELSTVQELNSTEIAAMMKIPAESVRTRLLRARQMLRAKLGRVLEVNKNG
jgi:RNA polymerase sigma-70 factor (ECF subfamily)